MKSLLHILVLLFSSFVLTACFHSDDGNGTVTYSVGGAVTGLEGTGLVLQNNNADDIAISTNGDFTFVTALADSSAYSVTVLTQPSSPNQTCTVSNGSGTLSGSNITNVSVTCVTNTYTIGGSVTGLSGSGLVLQNNGTDDLSVTTSNFTFAAAIADGTGYNISVLTHPTGLSQTCTASNNSGTVSGADITNVAITCTTNTFSIGGAVSGLTGTGLILQNNATDDLSIITGGAFAFAANITDGDGYSVSVLTEPTGQYCTISNSSGTLVGVDITNVSVECAHAYTNADLNGDYLFALTEIHDPGSNMTYCSVSGTMNFDGAGNLQVTTGTKRCKDSTDTITTTDISGATMTYSVNVDGSFTYASTHGQIVLDGSSLLLDGTLKGTNASDYLDRGIAMKRVTTGSPPTYTDASLNDNYLFNLTEIFNPGSTTYCDEAGNLIFGGAGTVTGGGSTQRCSDGVTLTITPPGPNGTLYYAVASDGSFTLSDSATDPEPLHGQILLDGSSALIDTSLMTSSGAHIMDIVAMKRVTAGSPPTYSNTSLNGNYLFIFTAIFNPGTVTYCDQAGTLSFNGAGTALGNGTMRCSDGTTVTTTDFSDTLDYDVASDGSFTLGGLIEPLHGQITLDGSSLLLDGTLMGTTAAKLLNRGIAMKRVAD